MPDVRFGRFLYRPEAGERVIFVMATKTQSETLGQLFSNDDMPESMKFSNGDDSLNDIVTDMMASGRTVSLPNKDMFMEAVSKGTWK